jgi:hypothetical protein
MSRSELATVVPVGTRWPSGTYASVAVLDASVDTISLVLGCIFTLGDEPGLGPWSAIGLRLESGMLVELIEYAKQPHKGIELRADSHCDLRQALDDTLVALSIGDGAVLWKTPLI